MEGFKTLKGKKIDNIFEYIQNYINENGDIDILIGSDSQSYSNRRTVYGVVIALHKKQSGAHVLCKRETVNFETNLQTRLITEVWKSVEIAEEFKKHNLPSPKYIDIDINPDKKYKSNVVLREAVGLVEGMGYKVRHKGTDAIVTYAANNLVRQ
jgi:predicted RNase H-related nuclease YkuK (DUF458 family)